MRNFKLPGKLEINSAFASFSHREWIVFTVFMGILLVSTLGILESINKTLMVSVPMRGGSIAEGIVGTPRFINPVLASSLSDQDLVALIYSGLMRKNPDGTLSPDLAERVEESKDGLTYTFTLKDKIYFHNGAPVTADDIIFTISKIKDEVIESPHKADWEGITVEKIGEKTIKFTLRQPYALFLENATLGILPAGIWQNSPIELNPANTNPIGSGPYMIENIYRQSSGIIDSYELVPFGDFVLGQPYVKDLTLRFYPNEGDLINALEGGQVNQISSIAPHNTETLEEKDYQLESSVLPRIFGLFFNQSQNQLFIDKTVVRAIDEAIDKEKIVREVLLGYGVAIDDPIPSNLIAYQKLNQENNISREETFKKVESDLAKAGWVRGADGFLEKTKTEGGKKTTTKLEFTISTGNARELAEAALLIEQDLRDVGMKVDIKTFEAGNLNQAVIRPRKYDALLFGQIINHESDLYAFWHSSQRKDPGLNVAMYTNVKVDKLLEDASITADSVARIKKYIEFEDEIKKDMPAVFLYSPDFIYVVSKNLKGNSIDYVSSPKDRFSDVYAWYTDTENVWKIFARN